MLLRTGLVLLLLLCGGVAADPQDGPPQALNQAQAEEGGPPSPRQRPRAPAPPAEPPLDFGFVPSEVYSTHAYYEAGPIGLLFHATHAFLYLVQPHPFPSDLIVTILQQNRNIKLVDLQKPENVVLILQTLYYEAGFVVCVCVGCVCLVLLPVVGLCFCACRCCENCGGEMHQRQRRNADCQRGVFTATLLATAILITGGVLFAYAANHNVSAQIKTARRLVNANMRDLKAFANNTPAQVDYLTSQYATAKNKILSDLDNIGPLLGFRIHSRLQTDVVPPLDTALRMAGAKVESAIKAMRETREALQSVGGSLEVLAEGGGRLAGALGRERGALANTLADPACSAPAFAPACTRTRTALRQLGLGGNYSQLPDLSPQLSRIDFVLRTDLSNIVQRGYSSFNDTPQLVTEQTKNIHTALPRVKGVLDQVGGEVQNFSQRFPVRGAMENFTSYLEATQRDLDQLYPQIDQLDFYRWVGGVALLCSVVLVLSFTYLGLLCGSCGHDRNATPTTRGCLSNTGGNLLMAGVAFSFLFCWVLMGVVVAAFVVGGNLEKLVCEPLANRQLFTVIDTPFMMNPGMKNFLPGMLFQNPEINLTLGALYRDCHDNAGLYQALQLETKFTIKDVLNTTSFSRSLSRELGVVRVDLAAVRLLERGGRDNLITFSNAGLGQVNYQAFLTEVNKGVTQVDLLSFSNDLEAQADQLPRGALANALKGHASSIRQIHKEHVVPMEQATKYVRARSTLNQSIRFLQKTAHDLPTKVANILSAIDAAEYLITHNASHVVRQETDAFVQGLMGYFSQYTSWVHDSLTAEVAQCKPISNLVDTAEIVGCSFIVDSVNTFCLGLGLCCVLLLPNIILSVKLAKFYRRMDTEDVFDDGQEGWN